MFRQWRKLSWYHFLPVVGILPIAWLFFFQGFDRFECLYNTDAYALIEKLVRFSRHLSLEPHDFRLLAPPLGPFLGILAWVIGDPLIPMFVTAVVLAVIFLSVLFLTARRWFGVMAAWMALLLAVSLPILALYTRWGLFLALFAMVCSVVLMGSFRRWLLGRSSWAPVLMALAIMMGMAPFADLHANNVVLLGIAMLMAWIWTGRWKVVIEARQWKWLFLALAGYAGLIVLMGYGQGYEFWWEPLKMMIGYVGSRGETFAREISLYNAIDRFHLALVELGWEAGGYYNVWPFFDKADAPFLSPLLVVLLLSAMGQAFLRQRVNDKILLSFLLVPLVSFSVFFDYAPRYMSLILPPALMLIARQWSVWWNVKMKFCAVKTAWRVAMVVFLFLTLLQHFYWAHENIAGNKELDLRGWATKDNEFRRAPDHFNADDYIEFKKLEPIMSQGYHEGFRRIRRPMPMMNYVKLAKLAGQLAQSAAGSVYTDFVFPTPPYLLAFDLTTPDVKGVRVSSYAQFIQRNQFLMRSLGSFGESKIPTRALFFFNMGDSLETSWNLFRYDWPPDRRAARKLPFSAIDLFGNAEGHDIIIDHMMIKQVKRTPGWDPVNDVAWVSQGRQFWKSPSEESGELIYFFETTVERKYASWCLLKPSASSSGVTAVLDQNSAHWINTGADQFSEAASLFWADLGDFDLKPGRHEIRWIRRGPGIQEIEHCRIIDIGPLGLNAAKRSSISD